MNKKRVCILTSVHFNNDNRVYYKEVLSLRNLGYEVVYIAPDLQERIENCIQYINVDKPTQFVKRLLNFYKIFKLAKKQKCYVYHFQDPELIPTGLLLKWFTRSKVIYDVHATARNAVYYRDVEAPQYYCLVGSEAKRLSKEFNKDNFKGTCILPPYPRIMGTDVPTFVHNVTYELKSIDFTNQYQDSCTALALQTAITLGAKNVMVVGYDGYPDGMLSVKERDLSNENRILFSEYKRYSGKNLNSLTPSLYKELEIESVYQYI